MGLPERIGNYSLLRQLGSGGMGEVLLARQLSMDRLVALKVLKPELARDADYVARFQREARSAAAVAHPNLVNPIECGCDRGWHYLSMEFVPGQSLGQRLKSEGPLDEMACIKVMKQVAAALRAAHQAGVVHRDVKPDNILLDAQGDCKLTDLGLAKRMGGGDCDLTMGGTVLGTPHYLPPEQAQGLPSDGRSDIYSLGATIWHLLVGKPVFQAPTVSAVAIKHVNEELPELASLRPGVSVGLQRILARCLAKAPADRFPDCDALLDELRRLEGGQVPTEAVVRRSPRTTPHRRANLAIRQQAAGQKGWLLPAALVGGGLLVLVVIGLVAMSSGAQPRVPPDRPEVAPVIIPAPTAPATAPAPIPDPGETLLAAALAHQAAQPTDFAGQEQLLAAALAAAREPALRTRIADLQTVLADHATTWTREQTARELAATAALAAHDYDLGLQEIGSEGAASASSAKLAERIVAEAGAERDRILAAGSAAVAARDMAGLDAALAAWEELRWQAGRQAHQATVDDWRATRAQWKAAAEGARDAALARLPQLLDRLLPLLAEAQLDRAATLLADEARALAPAGLDTETEALLATARARHTWCQERLKTLIGKPVPVPGAAQKRNTLRAIGAGGLTLGDGGAEWLLSWQRVDVDWLRAVGADWSPADPAGRLLAAALALTGHQPDPVRAAEALAGATPGAIATELGRRQASLAAAAQTAAITDQASSQQANNKATWSPDPADANWLAIWDPAEARQHGGRVQSLPSRAATRGWTLSAEPGTGPSLEQADGRAWLAFAGAQRLRATGLDLRPPWTCAFLIRVQPRCPAWARVISTSLGSTGDDAGITWLRWEGGGNWGVFNANKLIAGQPLAHEAWHLVELAVDAGGAIACRINGGATMGGAPPRPMTAALDCFALGAPADVPMPQVGESLVGNLGRVVLRRGALDDTLRHHLEWWLAAGGPEGQDLLPADHPWRERIPRAEHGSK